MAKRKIRIKLKPMSKAWGQAYDAERVVELDPRMDDHTMLQIAPHEVLHLLFPWISEESINEAGIDIGDVLWRLGFRRVDSPED